MPKFRKKPVVIEAKQLLPDTILEVYEFIYGSPTLRTTTDHLRWDDFEAIVRRDGLRLKTLESNGETQVASMGDYIIKGVHGEFYPCKPDIFSKTYEVVTEEHKEEWQEVLSIIDNLYEYDAANPNDNNDLFDELSKKFSISRIELPTAQECDATEVEKS